MTFIKLSLSSSLSKEEQKDYIVNTNFIVNIIDTGNEPLMYWTPNGFGKETESNIIHSHSFKEMLKLLKCREIKKASDHINIHEIDSF